MIHDMLAQEACPRHPIPIHWIGVCYGLVGRFEKKNQKTRPPKDRSISALLCSWSHLLLDAIREAIVNLTDILG
jgi:hypothetical protein